MKPTTRKGKVIFAGAGPGDPELITLKALRALRAADVVICDRLVSDTILDAYVRKEALVLHTGKQRNRKASTPQPVINELLVQYAREGKEVVRLKGGDVTVFSNIHDELETLVVNGIPYEIIPGITAASGASAYAGIPLTARSHSQAIRFLTLHQPDLFTAADFRNLARTGDTLVFYMSAENLDYLVNRLIAQGMGEDKYISVIEQATTALQQITTCRVKEFPVKHSRRDWISPTLVIIGKVAGLQEKFAWLPNSPAEVSYFKPLPEPKKEEARA